MKFGDRLRLARTRAGLSMAALASQVDPKISAQSVNKYEKGDMMPSSDVLLGLSKALNVTTDFLLSSQITALSGVEFRKRSGIPERDKAIVAEEVIDYVDRYLSIESVLGISDEATALDGVSAVEIDDLSDAEEVAKQIRKDWNLGGDPIPSMTAALEERNIRVIEIDGIEEMMGMTCRVMRPDDAPSIPVIVRRRRMNVERGRFTLAHEVCHAFIGSCKSGKLEKAMDRCAAALLMPAEHVRTEAGTKRRSLGYAELVRLKRLYAVSMWALLFRLGDLGIISDADLKNLFRTPARAWLKSEPEPLDENGDIAQLEKPRRFESLVLRALAEGSIQTNRAAYLLKKPVGDVEAAIRGPAPN